MDCWPSHASICSSATSPTIQQRPPHGPDGIAMNAMAKTPPCSIVAWLLPLIDGMMALSVEFLPSRLREIFLKAFSFVCLVGGFAIVPFRISIPKAMIWSFTLSGRGEAMDCPEFLELSGKTF